MNSPNHNRRMNVQMKKGNSTVNRDRSDICADTQTETDAVAEAFQVDPGREETEYDPNLFSKTSIQQETAIKTRQMTWDPSEKTDDNGIIDYTPFLPAELKYDNFEILILNAETDDNEAMDLKEHVENNVTFCGSLKPNVILLKDVIPINKDADPLDDAFKRTLYVVLYVTEEFCKDSNHLFQSHSCLKRALMSKEDRWSIIPVHTAPKNERKYELPLMLDGLRPLNYFSKTFYQDVKRLLDHKSNVILERRFTLAKMRQQYIEAKHKELYKLMSLSLGTQNVIVPTPKMKVNPPDIPIKASALNTESKNGISAEAEEQNQVTDFTCSSSQPKTKNTAAPHQEQQQQQQWLQKQQRQQQPSAAADKQQQQQTNTDALFTKKTYLRPKRSESEDNSSSITVDSPSDAEICKESNGKDISLEDSQQMGLQRGLDFNKSCYSSPLKTPTVKYSSLPEPADDKAVPEDLTPSAFNPTESNVSHKGSHINPPTGHSRSEASDIISKEGSHSNFNDGLQRVTSNTVPSNPITSSGASPSSTVHDVPSSSGSLRRLPENVSIAGSQVHIHIHQATYVAIGEHGQINVLSRSEDADDSEDLGNKNSYSQINVNPLPSKSEDTEDSEDSENGISYEI
ncbi:hypothetical protein BsWGS_01254 [Bradybaena similaris]